VALIDQTYLNAFVDDRVIEPPVVRVPVFHSENQVGDTSVKRWTVDAVERLVAQAELYLSQHCVTTGNDR